MAAAICTGRTWRSVGSLGCILRITRACHATALRTQYDALVIGGGHNGLVAAAYLQKGGVNTAVLERRHVLGGAAVSEEIIPGFRFSRASYLLSLLRPHIYRDLELEKHGLKVYMRNPHSFSPMLEEGVGGRPPRSLLLWADMEQTVREIGKFSDKDAKAFPAFVAHLEKLATAIHPLLDAPPVNIPGVTEGPLRSRLAALKTLRPLIKTGRKLGKHIPDLYELITAPIMKILNRWFDSEPLKAALARGALIGAMISPNHPGSGYVLLHHVMGELRKKTGAWGYVEGGMGGVSKSIANCARAHGVDIFTEQEVEQVLVGSDGCAKGVVLNDGTEVHSKVVLSNATAYLTFTKLAPQGSLSPDFMRAVSQISYTSPVTKINVAVDRLPNFLAAPNAADGAPGPHHQSTIHLNCESVEVLEAAYQEAQLGRPSSRPMLEMCIPSALDPTLAPPGCHVISLFTQFTPYSLEGGRTWTEEDREQYANSVFDWIDRYAPGFKNSIVGKDILAPPDLERIFGLTGGNIFHGVMSLDQLYLARPLPGLSDYRTPIRGLYLCGSGCHPDLESPEGLAVDHVGRNLFWTDSMRDRNEVASLDGTNRRVLFDADLINHRPIIADPAKGYLYWADWNRDAPKIEASYMDGTNWKVLVKDDLGLPNALTYDPQSSLLCWADAGQNYCSINSGGCTHLCLATPTSHSCLCPDNAVGVSCIEREGRY